MNQGPFLWSEEPVMEARIQRVLNSIGEELKRALTKFPRSQNSPHEGYAVLLEEVDELWDHVKADTGRSPEARKEAVQVAAMAMRYVLEVCA